MESSNIYSWPSKEEVNQFKKKFLIAQPFPHVVIDRFLENPSAWAQVFPNADWKDWSGLGDSYQKNKFICSNKDLFPKQISTLVEFLNSPVSLKTIEEITGINKLIPDPYLNGGGLHLSIEGGTLSPHTDFHFYEKLNLYRRVNLILYLNENWTEIDGGQLELALPNDSAPAVRVEPIFGRIVIFRTDDNSVHGFTNQVGIGKVRRSIALYYYTSVDSAVFSGDQTTYWREHGNLRGVKIIRLGIYKGLLKVSRSISLLAQVVNPNQGMKLVRSRFKLRN